MTDRGDEDRALRVLVIDESPPLDITDGSSLIARNLFPHLRRHHLTLLAFGAKSSFGGLDLTEIFDDVQIVSRGRPLPTLRGWTEVVVSGSVPWRLGRVIAPSVSAFRERLRQMIATIDPDVVHVRRLSMAGFVGDLGARPKLLEIVDSNLLATTRMPHGIRRSLRLTLARRIERRALPAFDIVTTVSTADAYASQSNAPSARVEVVENGVDHRYFAPLFREPDDGSIIFVGNLAYEPNARAVRWFVGDILPLVRHARPNVTFRVVGRQPGSDLAILLRDAKVETAFDVPDVRPLLGRASVVVCPMTSGSGIKNKVLEAMAMARAVVATTMAVEALDATDGQELLIADDPASFAAAVVRLIGDVDERTRLGSAGRALIVRRYSWERAAGRYDEFYRELTKR